jgi:hypothetical protein
VAVGARTSRTGASGIEEGAEVAEEGASRAEEEASGAEGGVSWVAVAEVAVVLLLAAGRRGGIEVSALLLEVGGTEDARVGMGNMCI